MHFNKRLLFKIYVYSIILYIVFIIIIAFLHFDDFMRDNPENLKFVNHYILNSEDEINFVYFYPVQREGSMGKGVIIPSDQERKMKQLYKINAYNLLASDRIPLNRTLPDYRNKECQQIIYPKNLPDTTVIIIFHNEAWSVLLRTIWSIINRTPKHLLKEIILVDDGSERTFLKDQLDEYVKTIPTSITVIRMGKRVGIVPSRLAGANIARGEVLTFLDSHCECSRGWAQPLLERILQDRHTVVCPVIDVISYADFSYGKAVEYHWGAFSWTLDFRWYHLDYEIIEKDESYKYQPIKTPAMSGGLFSIDRNYFFEMGGYDPEMKIWGGENIEMSFRIWQCGGKIEIHPCSHVGHVFRLETPYSIPGGINNMLAENYGRAALVWMDEWFNFFYKFQPEDFKFYISRLNVTNRLNLRKRLNCKPFSWYLENVWPLNFYPGPDKFFGKIVWLTEESKYLPLYTKIGVKLYTKNNVPTKWPQIFKILQNYNKTLLETFDVNYETCLSANFKQKTKYMTPITIDECHLENNLQNYFIITKNGHIMTNENRCLDFISLNEELTPTETNVRLYECTDNSRQIWNYNIYTQQIIHKDSKLCLTVDNIEVVEDDIFFLTAKICSTLDDYEYYRQQWGLVPLPWN